MRVQKAAFPSIFYHIPSRVDSFNESAVKFVALLTWQLFCFLPFQRSWLPSRDWSKAEQSPQLDRKSTASVDGQDHQYHYCPECEVLLAWGKRTLVTNLATYITVRGSEISWYMVTIKLNPIELTVEPKPQNTSSVAETYAFSVTLLQLQSRSPLSTAFPNCPYPAMVRNIVPGKRYCIIIRIAITTQGSFLKPHPTPLRSKCRYSLRNTNLCQWVSDFTVSQNVNFFFFQKAPQQSNIV